MRVQEDFTVPGTGGAYASETITFSHPIRRLVLVVLSLTASAEVEVDVLDEDGSTWHTVMASLTAEGISEVADFAAPVVEVRVRVKSGGSSGTTTVLAIGSRRTD